MQRVNSVFLIDDDPMFNMINKKIIQVAKFANKVTSYLSARDALTELRQLIETGSSEFPDIIFLDINMPQMDGWEFLEECAKFPAFALMKCKVFMLSSSISTSEIEKSKKYSLVYDFISKPLTIDKLEKIDSGEMALWELKTIGSPYHLIK
jgi:CheY-like chemotaxis protein